MKRSAPAFPAPPTCLQQTLDRLPADDTGRASHHWAVPADRNLFLNTGHGIFGWTLSMASAALTGQLVDGETPALPLEPFSPLRFAR